jgi:hypothetical protein
MDCRITYTRDSLQRAGAFSILESWVATGLLGLMMLAMVCFIMYTGRSFAGLQNYVDLEQCSQRALDTMTMDVRQTRSLKSLTTNQLVFRDWDGADLTYSYNPGAGTLVKSKGGNRQTLLTSCDFLVFSNFQRTPIACSDAQYPATLSATNTKLVSVTWVCSRMITGTKINTESVQTAKIVIRN